MSVRWAVNGQGVVGAQDGGSSRKGRSVLFLTLLHFCWSFGARTGAVIPFGLGAYGQGESYSSDEGLQREEAGEQELGALPRCCQVCRALPREGGAANASTKDRA